jgi:diacylglycerol kinase (ATP)
LAKEAACEGFETIVAAGGDGTVNEVLNGIVDVPGALSRTRLGVLPLGTVNVFAKELGIPSTLSAAWNVVKAGTPTHVDLPQVELQANGKKVTRLFAQLAGAGLDARAIELVSWPLKKRVGPLAYVYAGLQALAGPLNPIEVKTHAGVTAGELVLIGNGRLYGGYYNVFPKADLTDRLLEICVFPRVNWLTLVRCGPGLLVRGSLPAGVAQNLQSSEVELASLSSTGIELDGEWAGTLPARFSFHPSRLKVMVPPNQP